MLLQMPLNRKGNVKGQKEIVEACASIQGVSLLVCHVALRRKTTKAAKNVNIFAVVYERGFGG